MISDSDHHVIAYSLWSEALNFTCHQHVDGVLFRFGPELRCAAAISWYTVNGKLIAFVEPSSDEIYFGLLEEQINRRFPGSIKATASKVTHILQNRMADERAKALPPPA